jgi:hypothetical protein
MACLALVPIMLVCISKPGGPSGSMASVHTAGIAYEDRLFLHHMAAMTVSSARVDGMLVVETSTHRVAFDNLIAHCGTKSQRFERFGVCSAWKEVMKTEGVNATSVVEYYFTDRVDWRMRRRSMPMSSETLAYIL